MQRQRPHRHRCLHCVHPRRLQRTFHTKCRSHKPSDLAGQITFEWHQHAQRTGEDAISGGHKGPVQVYIAKAPSTAAEFDGQGAVWTKIYSSGLLNAQSQQWATDIVNADNGLHLGFLIVRPV